MTDGRHVVAVNAFDFLFLGILNLSKSVVILYKWLALIITKYFTFFLVLQIISNEAVIMVATNVIINSINILM